MRVGGTDTSTGPERSEPTTTEPAAIVTSPPETRVTDCLRRSARHSSDFLRPLDDSGGRVHLH